jgi:molybdate transport system substrate-binding protein
MKICLIFFSFVSICSAALADELLVFAGSAVKPPLDEIISEFKKKDNVTVNVSYGGSGFVLSQIELSRRGDIYLPASPDFMEKAKKKGLVLVETEKKIAYLLPVINVQKGNPKNIHSLNDLKRPGIRIGIGNPESVCVGLYAVEIFEFNKIFNEIEKNIVTYLESCEKTASVLAMGAVDAVIGWNVFENWRPNNIETIPLKPEEIPRIAYIPVAITKYTTNRQRSEKFIEFLNSDISHNIFKKHGYFVSENEIKNKAPLSQIGGEYIPVEYGSEK